MSITATELLTYASPIAGIALIVVIFMNMKMQALAKKHEEYKLDHYRQAIEKQIYELTKELSVNRERFNNINHLLVDAQNPYFKKHIDAAQVWSESKKINFFDEVGAKISDTIDDTLVFVLTPFNDQYDGQYRTIKTVVENLNFRCARGDDSTVSENILAHIIEQVSRSRIVIANISGRNPNVFYELGIAHALGKPVLIISESLADIPFDINSSRILAFETEDDLSRKLRNWFVHTLARTPINSFNNDAVR